MAKVNRSIYIGPNIPIWGMRRNMIFKGEIQIPEEFRQAIMRKPVINALFVTPSNLSLALQRINQKGSLEHIANNELLAIARAYHGGVIT